MSPPILSLAITATLSVGWFPGRNPIVAGDRPALYPLPSPRVSILFMRENLLLYYRRNRKQCSVLGAAAAVCMALSACAFSATNPWSQKQVIQPAALASQLKSSGDMPLLLHVGFESLYAQGHIPDSKYCGPGRSPDGIARLKTCLEGVSHKQAIVLYCGCCPWDECPNIRPAFEAVKKMGFTNVKVMHIANNFGQNWAHDGYPVDTGE
jgi:thiosulfate/3-mercaptopyruvate sulfurtransferase